MEFIANDQFSHLMLTHGWGRSWFPITCPFSFFISFLYYIINILKSLLVSMHIDSRKESELELPPICLLWHVVPYISTWWIKNRNENNFLKMLPKLALIPTRGSWCLHEAVPIWSHKNHEKAKSGARITSKCHGFHDPTSLLMELVLSKRDFTWDWLLVVAPLPTRAREKKNNSCKKAKSYTHLNNWQVSQTMEISWTLLLVIP